MTFKCLKTFSLMPVTMLSKSYYYFRDLIQTKIITLQIEQMGNASVIDNPHDFHTQSKREYFKEFKDTQTKFGQIAVYSNSKEQFFIGKEIDLPDSYGRQLLSKRLVKQQPQTQKVILPIEHFQFHTVSTVCSQQQKCLLLSKKPDTNLLQMYLQRRSKGQSFKVSQINSIISRIAQALKIQQKAQTHIQLDMESIIFVEGKAYLLDSLMQDGECYGQSVFGKYRAPQTYSGKYDQDEKGYELLCQLFSLGIIALCLSFTKINVQSFVYAKPQKTRRAREVNQSQIQNLLNQIKNQNLLNKLSVLLNFKPNVRQQIYDLIKETQLRNDKDRVIHFQIKFDQNVQKKNIALQKSIENDQMNRVVKLNNSQPFTRLSNKEVLKQQSNTVKISNNYPVMGNRIKNEPVSIGMRPPLKDFNVHNSQRTPSSNKQNQTYNTLNRELLKLQLKQSKQKDMHLTATPQRQRKRQQFSTIKEVTEYDDCYSISQSKSITAFQGRFQGNIIDGKKQGYGVLFFEEGSRYQGEWKNDKMCGFGMLFYYGNKLAYEGHWYEGQFHGIGKVYNSQPLILKEPFDYNDFNNLLEEWSSYEGNLQYDKRQGWGILRLSNGERFQGEFRQDMLQGHGTFYTFNKEQIRGKWSGSKLVWRQLF